MLLYQAPFISTIRQEPFQSHLQYQPGCSGNACSQDLGLDNFCFGPGGNDVGAIFFLPGRTDPTTPFNCVIVAEDTNNTSYNPVGSCNYLGPLSCAEGQVWAVECTFPDALCNTVGFQEAFISCDGELSSVCSGGVNGS